MSTEKFEAWLQAHEKTGEFFNLSEARAYQHPEEKYDEQYHIANETFVHGAGLVRSLRSARADFSGPRLELACGTGLLTVGLVRDCPYPSVIVTDASTKFLEITRRKLATFKSPAPVHLAVLLAEDLQRFPLGSLSLIVLRSALHHFIDVAAFIQVASRALKPGGVLAFEEPCEEGYLLMGLIGQVLTLPEFQRRLPGSSSSRCGSSPTR
ncbi:MAG: class I SAM-dependent methyltransferase [Verrucomicrobiota bacterium]